MLSAFVTTVSPGGRRARGRLRCRRAPGEPHDGAVVDPAGRLRAMRLFSGWCRAALYRSGSSYITSLATAPPWVRASMRCSSSSCRSRRTVASDTSSRAASAPTSTAPSLASTWRISLSRSARRTRRIYASTSLRARRATPLTTLHDSALVCAEVSETAQEVASQPEAWRRAQRSRPRSPQRFRLRASGSRPSDAARRSTSRRAFAALREAARARRDRRVPRLGVPGGRPTTACSRSAGAARPRRWSGCSETSPAGAPR